mmetsp:Transcript_95534/g.221610  ORF Transcript_95534/g.221610 Transcript_95534/m.221610 type:complete len:343 (+) Transcript_95534:44-1072(+)
MADSWRVQVEGVRDLETPKFRVGELARMVVHEDVKVKNAVVEVRLTGTSREHPQVTRPFDVDESGCAKIDQVFFVKKPAAGQAVLFRVVKPHRVQKDAVIGEAEVHQARGKQRVELTRRGKPRGYLMVAISHGISEGAPAPHGAPHAAPHTAPHGAPRGAVPAKPDGSSQSGARMPPPLPASPQPPSTVAKVTSWARGCFGGCFAGVAGLASKKVPAKGFLELKKLEQDVQSRPSGLLYRVLRNGTGKHHPTEDTPCECHYRGRLVDGTEFDSSYRTGRPARFTPREVIRGWSEALQLMIEGDVWELFIPPELAYGDRGVDGFIPSGAVLIFQVELLRVRRH